MPDIAMCMNKDCPARFTCYRYRAVPSEFRQSYAIVDSEECDLYWPIEENDRLTPVAELLKLEISSDSKES